MAERAALGALKPVEHAGERSGWLLPEANGAPIGVELVRGADGPGDDEWHVVVDGLRCRSGGAPGSEERLCYLPPPCNPTAPLGVDTRVRPVMVSVRLENEALRPDRVELTIEQVVASDEVQSASVGIHDAEALKTFQLPTYSVDDPAANAVILAYPFRAPSQSALGVLRWDRKQREERYEDLRKKRNDWDRNRYIRRLFYWSASGRKSEPPSEPVDRAPQSYERQAPTARLCTAAAASRPCARCTRRCAPSSLPWAWWSGGQATRSARRLTPPRTARNCCVARAACLCSASARPTAMPGALVEIKPQHDEGIFGVDGSSW